MQRTVSLTANMQGDDLGQMARRVDAAMQQAGEPAEGATVEVRGQIAADAGDVAGLRIGLVLSIVVIFLLLAGNFQSVSALRSPSSPPLPGGAARRACWRCWSPARR